MAEGLDGRAEWQRPQCAALAEAYVMYDTTGSHKLFCTEAEVLEYSLAYVDGDDPASGLQIFSWRTIEQQIAPAVAEANKKRAAAERQQEGRDILRKRLPPLRKLKAMKGLDRPARGIAAHSRTAGTKGIGLHPRDEKR